MSAAVRFFEVVPQSLLLERQRPLSLEVPAGAAMVVETSPTLGGWLVRLCAGLVLPGAGGVEVLGMDLTRLGRRATQRLRHRLGVALCPDGLVSNLSLYMNLVVPLVYGGVPPAAAARRASEMLERCQLAAWTQSRPTDVPPDIRKITALARAVVRRPDLAVLEDPVSAVPDDRAEELLSLCRRDAGTVVITTPRRRAVFDRVTDLSATWDGEALQLQAYEVGTL